MVAGSPAKEVGKVTGESSMWKSVRVCVLAVVEKTCVICGMQSLHGLGNRDANCQTQLRSRFQIAQTQHVQVCCMFLPI